MNQPALPQPLLTCAGQTLPYRLVRSPRRRTIGLKIDEQGLTVFAPPNLPGAQLETLIQTRAAWIRTKWTECCQKSALRVVPREGALLPYLGRTVRLSLDSGPTHLEGEVLYLNPGRGDITVALQRWYQAQALPFFLPRVAHYAGQLGVPLPAVALSNARRRWGSCHARGMIRLNWRLLKASLAEMDYVIAHEVAHLRHMNHGPTFRETLQCLYPNHAEAHRTLRERGFLYHAF
ncbi:M48 family metallopeptidase [Ferrovum myxofaciens]|uniref:M48 family metallopeptidase n=1 Tax=Ferrovum myxofaciens TaxID=416213 RepID=A0A9E6MU78_9PROT|nr:SprT family zinc-dependent metalloprotease [Ferrovum myxofaciens]MBU6994452.1 M48 family metallopeptidase [Ferrovum myxofaciens]QKE38326.1 MAG: M48 family metallopeptidase [Ferrovum myxofaciens]QWY76061.1 MAG: M48 family metallopeptidase [Ferrovum myxofaciens]QWY76258.1 MAG: M48 family metallopeptidase [Ferrovum myxofaciens]